MTIKQCVAGAEGVLPRNVSPAFVQSREMFNESVSLTGNGKGGGRLFKRRGFQKKKIRMECQSQRQQEKN